MALSFLNPWFWLAALAVAAPVWLHLRRRKERHLIRFSAVRFLQDQPRARTSPFRLERLWLLLLRALAVLLIIAAFAWPYLRHAGTASIQQSVVYILDNTLSHQANDGFKADCVRLVQEINRAGPEVQIGVVELAVSPRVVVGFGESRAAARQSIQELAPSFERGSYLAAFRLANSLLSSSLGRQRRVVLLGDNQANQWNQEASTPPFLQNVRVELPRNGSLQQPNLWLCDAHTRRLLLGNKSSVNFTMRLGHLGPARSARVVLRVNEQTVLNRLIDLEHQPQNILVQAQCEADPASWVRAQASVEGTPDALPADNHLFISVPPVVEGRVALLAQSPYLRLAFSPDIMRGQWSSRVLDPSGLAAELASDHDAEVLCIESAFLQNPEARGLVKKYLSKGKGVFLVLNQLSPAIDGFLRELGFEPEEMVEDPRPQHFQFVMSNHPIFHPFQSSDLGNLMKIQILRHARLGKTGARPLIFSQTGDGLFYEGTHDRGKLFVCAFGLDRDQSSWPVDPTFIPFIDLTLQAARPRDTMRTAFKPGATTVIHVPAGQSAHTVVLRDGRREVQRATIQHERAQLRLPGTPGLYTLSYDDRAQVEQVLSVNPDAKESELEFVDSPQAVKDWCMAPGTKPQPLVSVAGSAVGFSGILQQHLWWWMVLGGLLALGLETAWAEAKGEAG